MFEAAELNRKVSKAEFDALAPSLRVEMVQLQQELRRADFPVIVLFAGVDGAGKSESVNLLNEWMDPRWLANRAYGHPSDEERERPEFWRYWRDLPPKGHFGLFLSAWYSQPLLDRVHGRIGRAKLDARLQRIVQFERTLADDGAVILKFWMHLNKKAQKKRLEKLEKDPDRHWKITDRDWKHYKLYDKFISTAERMIMQTSSGRFPWKIVEGADSRYRALTVLTTIRDRVREELDRRAAEAQAAANHRPRRRRTDKAEASAEAQAVSSDSILDSLDLSQAVSRDAYSAQVKRLRARLHAAFRQAQAKGVSSVLVFEGWDAAGKGGGDPPGRHGPGRAGGFGHPGGRADRRRTGPSLHVAVLAAYLPRRAVHHL